MSFLGRRIRPKIFGFVPRHYDPEKEAIERSVSNYAQTEDKVELSKDRIKMGLRGGYRGNNALKKAETRKSNFRLFYVLIIIVVATILLLRSRGITEFLEAISK